MTQTIEQLRLAHPWPSVKPDVSATDHGWLREDMKRVMTDLCGDFTRSIVEVGSWLGKTARFLCDSAPNATVYCVDHWRGSSEHHYDKKFEPLLPVLFDTFCVNCWDYRDRIVPVRMCSVDGMRAIAAAGVEPDLVYIDASHEYPNVLADVDTARNLFPGATIFGDDWKSRWRGVTDAVTDYLKAHPSIEFAESGKCWIMRPSGGGA